MKVARSHSSKFLVLCVFTTIVCLCLAPNLTAQATDPGPRPMGTSPFLDGTQTVCQIILSGGGPFKFNPVICSDFDQPPSRPPQPPAAGAGQLIANPGSLAGFWGQGLTVFSTTATVTTPSGAVAPPTIAGLGPSFNALSCFGCHAQPAVGGASPGVITLNGRSYSTTGFVNPEILAASADGATNTLPCFLFGTVLGCGTSLGDFPTLNFTQGPVVEVRFPNGLTGTTGPNIAPVAPGAVANLFTFEGRSDAPPSCTIGQEPITAQIQAGNAIFRTPTPTFGLGLVENTSELTLMNSLAANATLKAALGIHGTFNHSGNDQTITRFGWKAQNKSLMMFAGEASNVEMGVTNELFPNERTTGSGANCTPNDQPEDEVLGTNPTATDPSVISSVMQNNAVFMRLNAAPSQCDFTSTTDSTGAPVCLPLSATALQGQCVFGAVGATVSCSNVLPPTGIGCVLCHQDSLTTANSSQPGLSNFTYAPYSDFALHNMGVADSDRVSQGQATPQQFRTAPLWGTGQRFFFMHDGRYFNLDHAIRNHCPDNTDATNESCAVIQKYLGLSTTQQNALLAFLRSL